MKCPLETGKSPELLLEYPTGRLDPAVQTALEEHVAVCFDCQQAIEGNSAVWEALDAWEPVPVSMDFNHRLWQKIEQAEADRGWFDLRSFGLRRFGLRRFDLGRFNVSWKPALPVALLLVVGAIMVHNPREPLSIQSVAGTNGVTLSEVDQVESALDDLQLLQQLDSVTKPDSNAASRI
jgi:hypothetical protein